ncbi:MAG TPA: hypothetical protein VIG99_12440 [Myxococcaceae bacterium]|jgi:hypothetical protein
MATDLKLPFSAGAETSSVSFDPRRQVAPAGGDEITQVTQSGGKPALDVGGTIDAQFAAGEPAPSGDAFADGPPGNTPNDLDARTAQYVAKRKSVHGEYAKKAATQQKLKAKHAEAQLNKLASKKALANRKANQQASMAAQAKRRNMWSAIDQANAKREIGKQQKAAVVKTTDARTTSTKDTQVKTADVKTNVQSAAVVNAAVADPAKKQGV